MTGPRACDWCDQPIPDNAKPEKTTCTDQCRLTLSKWRRGIGPFAPDGPEVDDHGRGAPANPTVAREHRDRDRLRARRALGRVPSDRRVQETTAVDVAVACMRMVSSVSAADARAIAAQELADRGRARV